ncbi:MAG TPA: peptide deformylase [Burkholderiales bacterium]|jgi:peptide deformylase|nr:peptide deformylase [Burkholderiales bacterium]
MALRPILRYPDPRLRKVAAPVREVNDEIRALVADMAETMYAAPGIGLAATQIDVHLRVIVIDISQTKDRLLVLINPEILESRGQTECEEGCLSVPGVFETVTRAEWVRVRALDQQGRSFEMEASGLLAICIQHEMDHLAGKVFVEYLSPLKRERIVKKLRKAERVVL